MDGPSVHGLVDQLFRREAVRLVGRLTRLLGPRHLDLAEDVVHEAMMSALQVWPFQGVPAHPDAWLLQVARNRALDRLRRAARFADRAGAVALELERGQAPVDAVGLRPVGAQADDDLAMVFMACHPGLPEPARLALTLKTVFGLGTREIARLFLVPDATIGQRLVRAKRALREQNVRFEIPVGAALDDRLPSVLAVVYLVFTAGHTAAEGQDLVRAHVCDEAIRLGGTLAGDPRTGRPEVHALVALMCLHGARLGARTDEAGELALLDAQDRTKWDRARVARGFRHLAFAAAGDVETRYHVEAAIAACHAAATSADLTDWPRILSLYERLREIHPSPVTELNRLVAVAHVHGAEAALDALANPTLAASLRDYYLYHSVTGRLRERLGDVAGAAAAYRQALSLRCSEPERRWLEGKLRGG